MPTHQKDRSYDSAVRNVSPVVSKPAPAVGKQGETNGGRSVAKLMDKAEAVGKPQDKAGAVGNSQNNVGAVGKSQITSGAVGKPQDNTGAVGMPQEDVRNPQDGHIDPQEEVLDLSPQKDAGNDSCG
jgi:hypothetical protein